MVEVARKDLVDITSVTKEELCDWLESQNEPAYRADQILKWIYQQGATSFDALLNLPKGVRQKLENSFYFPVLVPVRQMGSRDTTRKFLFRLKDGQMIETVLIPANEGWNHERSDRFTLCISTQVGCAMACGFCASGLFGLKRNLDVGEIVGQVLESQRLGKVRVDNIVVMGMGEPLANYKNLMKALTILNAPWATSIGARKITVSTSGLAPQIRRLAEEPQQFRLAISLHGATDEVRSRIMPINKKYPLAELIDACEEYMKKSGRRISFEYILIDHLNDTIEQAEKLARLARRLSAKVNCIPYNTVDAFQWKRPSTERQDQFMERLKSAGVPATIRREKGHDIAAACGQLKLQEQRDITARGTE